MEKHGVSTVFNLSEVVLYRFFMLHSSLYLFLCVLRCV